MHLKLEVCIITLYFSWCRRTSPTQDLSYTWSLSHLVGNPITAAAVKKIINERLSYKTAILSLLHLHVESYVAQQGKQRSWLLGALRGFLCGGCHRNGILGCGCEADSCWGHLSPGATGTSVQLCSDAHLTQASPFLISACHRGDKLHPQTPASWGCWGLKCQPPLPPPSGPLSSGAEGEVRRPWLSRLLWNSFCLLHAGHLPQAVQQEWSSSFSVHL